MRNAKVVLLEPLNRPQSHLINWFIPQPPLTK